MSVTPSIRTANHRYLLDMTFDTLMTYFLNLMFVAALAMVVAGAYTDEWTLIIAGVGIAVTSRLLPSTGSTPTDEA